MSPDEPAIERDRRRITGCSPASSGGAAAGGCERAGRAAVGAEFAPFGGCDCRSSLSVMS
jgi:hypothetical protein